MAEEQFNESAKEAKIAVQALEKTFKKKADEHSRTLDKIKEKCNTQFETQRDRYKKYSTISEERQNFYSANALNKYKM